MSEVGGDQRQPLTGAQILEALEDGEHLTTTELADIMGRASYLLGKRIVALEVQIMARMPSQVFVVWWTVSQVLPDLFD